MNLASQEMHTESCSGPCITKRLYVWVHPQSKHYMGKQNRLGYPVKISWVRKWCRSTHSYLVQGSAQLREAFPALAPDTEHASLLWRRRCRACEKVTQAMAAVLPASGAPAGVAQRPVMRPRSWMLDISHISQQSTILCTKDKAGLPLPSAGSSVLRHCNMSCADDDGRIEAHGCTGGACASGGQPGAVSLPYMLCRLQVMHAS